RSRSICSFMLFISAIRSAIAARYSAATLGAGCEESASLMGSHLRWHCNTSSVNAAIRCNGLLVKQLRGRFRDELLFALERGGAAVVGVGAGLVAAFDVGAV